MREIKITFVVLLIIFKSYVLISSTDLFIYFLVDNFFFVPYYVSLKNKNITVF